MTGKLYAIGWRARGCPRRWQVSYCESLDQAVQTARSSAQFAGGGRWRVYEMRSQVAPNGMVHSVKGRMLAEGLEAMERR